MGKKQDPDPGLTTRIIFPRAYKPILWVKILKFFDADPGSGMEKIRIRDPGWKTFGSGFPGSATLTYRTVCVILPLEK
jgi:hypothetical protein